MSETAPNSLPNETVAQVSEPVEMPYALDIETDERLPFNIKYNTFEEAQQAEKKYSDEFIDNVLGEESGGLLPFKVGTESVGLKGYLDKVVATETDKSIPGAQYPDRKVVGRMPSHTASLACFG